MLCKCSQLDERVVSRRKRMVFLYGLVPGRMDGWTQLDEIMVSLFVSVQISVYTTCVHTWIYFLFLSHSFVMTDLNTLVNNSYGNRTSKR